MRPNHSPEPIAVGEISHHAKGFARPDSSRSKNPSRPHQSGVALRFPPQSGTRPQVPAAFAFGTFSYKLRGWLAAGAQEGFVRVSTGLLRFLGHFTKERGRWVGHSSVRVPLMLRWATAFIFWKKFMLHF